MPSFLINDYLDDSMSKVQRDKAAVYGLGDKSPMRQERKKISIHIVTDDGTKRPRSKWRSSLVHSRDLATVMARAASPQSLASSTGRCLFPWLGYDSFLPALRWRVFVYIEHISEIS